MNNHMQSGGHPPALPMHAHNSRRDQYHNYHHAPQSPVPPNYYAGYHQAQFHAYGHTPPQYRWQQPPYPQQHFVPPPHMQQAPYQPRSPMVVSSQPHGPPMTPVTRQQQQNNVMGPPTPQSTHSPRPFPPYMQQPPQAPAASPSPVAAPVPVPVPAPAPKPEEPRTETPPPVQPEPTRRPSTAQNPLSLPPEHKEPFWPSLPWYSLPNSTFPSRATPRRRRRRNLRAPNAAVALPTREENANEEKQEHVESQAASAEELPSETSTIAAPSEPETPATSQAPSESDYTQASTPVTPAQASDSSPKPTPTQQHARRDTRTAIAVPNIPNLPKPKEASPSATVKQDASPQGESDAAVKKDGEETEQAESTEEATVKTPPPKPAPKSWADLVRPAAKSGAPSSAANGQVVTNGFQLPKSASLAEALRQYNVNSDAKLPFLEPRGLVNTGNMCYMNSILQILVFCVPFYNFLDQVRQRTVHSLKSETPLVDAMIMFMEQFKVLASADSVEGLRSVLKQEQLEMYGEPLTPDYVYDAIRRLPRFAGMRRGHQQDAEEFLGFLLEGLHDECVNVMKGQTDETKFQENGLTSPSTVMSPNSADGWLEVGPKQKAAVTRTAGQQEEPSPVTKIFGGHLRSELKVSHMKPSITLEPYKPLQLDIGDPAVNNIIDALKGITRSEQLTGEFGNLGTANKQVFIDTLPPVLILHLKRFQYDNSFTGTQKIWKKVGYPLELEIPKEVFSPAKRGGLGVRGGPPKYRLTSVVYHHGKSAAGGHYTVDVLREDSREWVRIDDTVIRRIRPEDVAEGGAEEDPKVLAKALEQHKADQDLQKQRNMYEGLDEADKEPEEEKPWSEVNGHPNGHSKKWSGVAANTTTNGTATPSSATGKRTPTARKEGVRDNKVAYILLYERIRD